MMLTAIQNTQTSQLVLAPQAPVQKAPAQKAQTELRPTDSVLRTAAIGQIPGSIGLFAAPAESLDKAIQALNSNPTEQGTRNAQAGFRVGIRAHDLKTLYSLQSAIQSQIRSNSDFRTQRFLAEIQVDLFMEIHAKGGNPNVPAVTAPALPGNRPEAIVQGSLKKLASHMSESNYRDARAGFRVSLRSLSNDDLLKTKQLVSLAVQTGSDYRQQMFLDDLLEDVLSEQITRNLQTNVPALGMPPVLVGTPADIARQALKLLDSNLSEANFRTSVAALRVAARNLPPASIPALKAELVQAMSQTTDYRTQIYLDLVARELR